MEAKFLNFKKNIKILFFIICALLVQHLNVYASETPKGVSFSLNNNYYYWNKSDSAESGSQFVSTIAVNYSYINENISTELGLKTGHIKSELYSPVRPGIAQSQTDTVVTGTLKYVIPKTKIIPFMTTSVNLPTGKATLRGSEKNAIMDLDLVEQVRLGEGFNANIGCGVTIYITDNLFSTLAVGKTFRDPYIPDGDVGLKYHPGDSITGYAEIGYEYENYLFIFGLLKKLEDESTLDGESYFDPGDSVTIYGSISTQINESNLISASISLTQYDKNKFYDPFQGEFIEEEAASSGEMYMASLSWRRNMKWGQIGLDASYLLRTENDYDPENDLFVPARERYLVGPMLRVGLNENCYMELFGKYMVLNEEKYYLSGVKRSYSGLWSSLNINMEF